MTVMTILLVKKAKIMIFDPAGTVGPWWPECGISMMCEIKRGMPGRPFGSRSISATPEYSRGFVTIVGRVSALGGVTCRGVGRDCGCPGLGNHDKHDSC